MNFEESMQAARAAKQRRAEWLREQVACGHITPCSRPGDPCGCQHPAASESSESSEAATPTEPSDSAAD